MKKKLIILVTIIIIAAAILFIALGNRNSATQAVGIKVETGNYEEIISGIGFVEYEKEIIVRSEVEGQIISMVKNTSDRVAEGDLLLEIDDKDAALVYDDLQASIALSKARLADYKITYKSSVSNVGKQKDIVIQEISGALLSIAQLDEEIKKIETLVEEGITPVSELILLENKRESFLSTIETLKSRQVALSSSSYSDNELTAAIEISEKNLEKQDNELKKYQIVSRLSGVVMETYAKSGELIQKGQDLMKIASDNKKYVVVEVAEKYLGNISIGKEANLVIEQYPDKVTKAIVIETAPFINKETGTIEVKVEISENKELFLQNMTVGVDFTTVTFQDAIVIPGDYMVDDNSTKVYVLNDQSTVSVREISVYNKNVPSLYITEGLKIGDVIIKPTDLEPNMLVEVIIKGVE